MRKLIAEPIFIFLSILGSLWVDGYTDELKEKEGLNDSIITLSKEISKNMIAALGKPILRIFLNKNLSRSFILRLLK